MTGDFISFAEGIITFQQGESRKSMPVLHDAIITINGIKVGMDKLIPGDKLELLGNPVQVIKAGRQLGLDSPTTKEN